MTELRDIKGHDPLSVVTVGLGERSYRIQIGSGTLKGIGESCQQLGLGKRLAVITNPMVASLYLETVRTSLEASGFVTSIIMIPDGEAYKNIVTLTTVLEQLVINGLDRGGSIVALGGGVVGDLAGFAAATFLRGINFVQVPTTLLAQVDSSVGGKTGVNLPQGKNLVGAFYQPLLVTIDVDTLATLPEKEYLGGLAEVIKYGIVLDRELFEFIEQHCEEILNRDKSSLERIIARCCMIKADVVGKDERETGLRAVLNYGHTLGHAVESLTDYSRYSHGEAVAIGMVAAAQYSEMLRLATGAETKRIIDLMAKMRLPIAAPGFKISEYSMSMMRDKKARDGGLTFVCNKGIGDFSFVRIDDLQQFLITAGIGG